MNQPEYLSSPSYHLIGKVIRGRGIGKLIGTPTADIQVSFPQEMPPTGVYISMKTFILDCQNARDFFRMPRLDTHTAPDSLPESIMQIDTCQRSVSLNGREIALTTREYDVLLLLASHPGRAYSKEQIYEGVWHEPSNEYYPISDL